MPGRKKRVNKYLSENFKEIKKDTFQFEINGYTGTFEFRHKLVPSKAPYIEWLNVYIALPVGWSHQQIERILFLCESSKVSGDIYLTSYFYGTIKLNKIMKFLELQTHEINRRV